ncbi:MAG: hypothetical protein JOY62_00510 [Acidobacteriaceae bacterium]|nr:hypothetical protein [Acidobacteriaceae bacterium]MBV9778426.1 hypothetical protein [Acidobacteriaceae bacterium]
MQVETALFFETIEQIYARAFCVIAPHIPVPPITIRFRRYANANSRIKFDRAELTVYISDLLEGAPAPIKRP